MSRATKKEISWDIILLPKTKIQYNNYPEKK
jgi:hypothetical protein